MKSQFFGTITSSQFLLSNLYLTSIYIKLVKLRFGSIKIKAYRKTMNISSVDK